MPAHVVARPYQLPTISQQPKPPFVIRPKTSSSSTTSQFYPEKCQEIVAISNAIKSRVESKLADNHIYVDITDPKSPPPAVTTTVAPAPKSGIIQPPAAAVQCYVTSIEDDAYHAEEVERQRDLTLHYSHIAPNRHFAAGSAAMYAMSMPWINVSPHLHHQHYHHQYTHQASNRKQHYMRPSLHLSTVDLCRAKACLKAAPHVESSTNASLVDYYSSYSEVILELKNRFNAEVDKFKSDPK